MTTNTNKITLKQIDAEISTFVTSRKALQTHAHNIAMMILRHAAPAEVSDDCVGSGDCTRALKLVAQMPKSWAAQMETWFKAFSPIRVVSKNNKCEFDPAYKKLAKDSKIEHWNLEEAAQTPFFELTDEPEVGGKILDFAALLKLIEQQASRIKKNVEEGKVREEDVPSALAMAEKLAKIKFSRVPASKPANTNETSSGVKASSLKAKSAA